MQLQVVWHSWWLSPQNGSSAIMRYYLYATQEQGSLGDMQELE